AVADAASYRAQGASQGVSIAAGDRFCRRPMPAHFCTSEPAVAEGPDQRSVRAMIALPAGVKVWLAAGATDMRKGFDGLAALVQMQLAEDPFSGQLFVFRGRAGDRVKILWWSGDGMCLFAKRLERGRFVWPQATHGSVSLTSAQLSMLLEGIDWRAPVRTVAPQLAV